MVKKSKIITSGLLAGLLGLLTLTGCVPTAEGEPTGFNWTSVAMVIILIALFYFFIIRPQGKRRKDQQNLIASLKPGDRVITAGGIYGEIDSLSEDSVVLKVESGAKIRVAKQGLLIKRSPGQ